MVPTPLELALVRPKPLYPCSNQPAAAAPLSEVKKWLVDTGCGHDLVCKAEVEKVIEYVEKGKTLVFDTAGGEVPACNVIPLFLAHMQQQVRPYILDSTTNVLSVGARCQQMG